jgi:hypothetical protein
MTDYSEILRLATIINAPDEYFTPGKAKAFEADLEGLSRDDMALCCVASKLLAGRGYSISSDNPETFAKYRALAEHMGATVSTPGSPPRQIVLSPPPKH